MQITSRFTIALHIFACIEAFGAEQKVTGELIAGSVQTNPVVVRKILSRLREAGLIRIARGTGGAELARDAEDITFFDVYRAVDAVDGERLFRFHANPNPDCPVGRNIHLLLDDILDDVQAAMENELKTYTIADLNQNMDILLQNEEDA